MVTLDRAWCVLCALTARKPAHGHGHGHGHGQKAEKNELWRKLRHKSDCCCVGWAVYAPWACYMNLRTLYLSKLAKCPLTCLADLAGDRGGGGGGGLPTTWVPSWTDISSPAHQGDQNSTYMQQQI